MINKRLIAMMGGSIKWVVLNVALKWLGLFCNVAIIFAVGYQLQNLFSYKNILWPFVILICISVILRYFLLKRAAGCAFHASANVKETLRNAIYRKLLRTHTAEKADNSTSELLQISVEGVEQLEIYFSKYLPQFFYSLLAPLTLFAILAFFDIKAAVVLLLCVPMIPASIMVIVKFTKKLLAKYWSQYTSLGDHFLDNLQGLTTLKIYDRDESYHKKMNVESEYFRKITMKVLSMQLNSVSMMDLMAYGSAAVGASVAVWDFANGRIGLAAAFAIIMLAAEFFLPLRLLGSFFHIAMNGMAASEKIFAFLDSQEQEQPENPADFPQGSGVTLSGVTFSYGEESFSIKDISMEIPANSFVAFVGESGCGKSSVAALIRGGISNYAGDIFFGDVNGKALTKDARSKHIVTIASNSYIFKGSVRDNLLMAKPAATDEEMAAALEKVNLYDELGSLGYQIAERGANLSGGQRQRLSIARALLFDADIYIFDEATSGIDSESEEMIMNVIQEMRARKTVILISHRLYNAVNSDNIFVFHDGTLVENGLHAELLDKNGVYSKLYEGQQQYEKMGKGAAK